MKALIVIALIASLFGLEDLLLAGVRTAGRWTARFEVAQGNLTILSAGMPPPWRRRYEAIVKQRYGVEITPVAGCLVYQPIAAFLEGHNEVVILRALQKFGRDIFLESMREASVEWSASK